MRIFIMTGAVLALAACGGGHKATNNATTTNSMTTTTTTTGNMAAPSAEDRNMVANSVNDAAANGSINSSTRNMMLKDANTHDADTNLHNGL